MKSYARPLILFNLTAVLILGILFGMGVSVWTAANVQASSVIRVTSTADSVHNDGACSLRGAIIAAKPGFSDRIIHVLSGNETIQNVTISMGNVSGSGGGTYNSILIRTALIMESWQC